MSAITLHITRRKLTPPTPVNSAIWMSASSVCRATPSEFQPKPVMSQPRTHSSATHAAATNTAIPRFRADINNGGRSNGTSGSGGGTGRK